MITDEDIDASFALKEGESEQSEKSERPMTEPIFLQEDEDGNLSF